MLVYWRWLSENIAFILPILAIPAPNFEFGLRHTPLMDDNHFLLILAPQPQALGRGRRTRHLPCVQSGPAAEQPGRRPLLQRSDDESAGGGVKLR